ncbi:hypothetical protein FA95DRAFT_1567962, partial [Auriscalpium vulgare]
RKTNAFGIANASRACRCIGQSSMNIGLSPTQFTHRRDVIFACQLTRGVHRAN